MRRKRDWKEAETAAPSYGIDPICLKRQDKRLGSTSAELRSSMASVRLISKFNHPPTTNELAPWPALLN